MKKMILIVFIVIICISGVVAVLLLTKKVSPTIPEIESLTVFGQKINVVPGKNVYRISMKNASINEASGGCENPIAIKFNNSIESSGGIYYYKNNETEAHFYIDASTADASSNDSVDAYDVYIQVILDNPLFVAEKCR